MDAITQWGFWDGRHWRPGAGLYRQDWSLRPNGQQYIDLIRSEWNTTASGTSNSAGSYSVRGFHGSYDITATASGQTSTQRGVVLTRSGNRVVITLNVSAPPTGNDTQRPKVWDARLLTAGWWRAQMDWNKVTTDLAQSDVFFYDYARNVRVPMNQFWLQNDNVNGRTFSTLHFNAPLSAGWYEWRFEDGAGRDSEGRLSERASYWFLVNAPAASSAGAEGTIVRGTTARPTNPRITPRPGTGPTTNTRPTTTNTRPTSTNTASSTVSSASTTRPTTTSTTPTGTRTNLAPTGASALVNSTAPASPPTPKKPATSTPPKR
jgi:hypothetical protein